MTSASRKITFKNGSCNIESVHNQKTMLTTIYMKFKTSQKELLNAVLQKYIHEKVLGATGVNAINDISSAYATTNGIVIVCTERKIVSNIPIIFGYIMKTSLSAEESKYVENGDYTKMHKECMDFNVYICGKCKNFNRALENSGDKKLERLSESFGKLLMKDDIRPVETQPNHYKQYGTSISISLAGRSLFDLCCVMRDIPFVIDGGKLIVLSLDATDRMKNTMSHSSCFNNQLKSWLLQAGSIGSPSSNDDGGKKYKLKCDTILKSMSMMSFICADIHGVKYRFSSLDELKTVNKESLKSIKTVKL